MTEEEEFEFRARAEAEQAAGNISDATAATETATETASGPAQNTFGQGAKRMLGLTARAAGNVLASPLTLGGNVLGKAMNAIAGKEVFQPSTDVVDAWMTKAGLPQAEQPLEKIAQSMARSAPAVAIPGGYLNQVLGNAAIGAADTPTGQETQGAAYGALGGGLGHVLSKALGHGMPGISKEARQLMDKTGIQPTVGMAVPKLRALEEFSTGIPILGEATKAARGRAIGEFSTESISRAVPTMPKSALKGSPFEQIDMANDHVSSIYYDVLPKVKPELPTNVMGGAQGAAQAGPSAKAFEQGYVQAKANNYLTDAQQEILDRVYQNHGPKISSYTGEQLKTLDSELGEQIRKYQRGAGTSDLADSLAEMQLKLREGIELRLPPAEQGRLAGANRSYRELIALNDAASKTPEMTITPQRLAKALAARDKKPITRVSGDMADYARSAENVVPNSAGARGISAPGLASAVAGTGLAAFTGKLPLLLAGGGVGALGATRTGQAALTGNTITQRVLREWATKNPGLAPAVGAAVLNRNEE
jgi:hypothetical protein